MKLIKIITLSKSIISLFAFKTAARDTIKIVGSSTVYPYATVVAENFGKTGKFKTPVIESTGTGGGMKLFCAGVGTNHPDITNASRKIKSNEIALCAKNGVTDIIEITIGNDGLTLAHSLDAADADFTQEQLYLALAAKVPANIIITDGNVIAGELIDNPYINWSDIDPSLPNHKIEILIAPPTSGTRDAWNSLIMSKGCKKSGAYKLWEKKGENAKKKCNIVREDGGAIEAGENDTLIVQKLASNPEKYNDLAREALANEDKIKSVSIAGIQPSLEGIQDYSYPIARPLQFYVKKAHIGVVPGIKEFLVAFTSLNAMGTDGYLTDIGLVALDADAASAVRSAATNLETLK